MNNKLTNTAVAAVVAGALLFFTAAPRVHADDDRGKYQHAIEKAEMRLDKTIQKHGEHSHEAEERQRDLNAERDVVGISITSGGTGENIAGKPSAIGNMSRITTIITDEKRSPAPDPFPWDYCPW